MASSVQFEVGKPRTLSPFALRALSRYHSTGRCFFGSQPCVDVRKEKMRSLARLFSSSRRAPPKATSKPWRSSACFSPSVFHMSVWRGPWSNGLIPRRSEEHTSELQSLMRISYAVFCLKKKNNQYIITDYND